MEGNEDIRQIKQYFITTISVGGSTDFLKKVKWIVTVEGKMYIKFPHFLSRLGNRKPFLYFNKKATE